MRIKQSIPRVTLCTGRRMIEDLKLDCNTCSRFRTAMILDSDHDHIWWITIKPNRDETCPKFLSKVNDNSAYS